MGVGEDRKRELKNKYEILAIAGIFLLFFAWLLLQFSKVGVYFDDYGYYALNYMSTTRHIGTAFTLPELFRYMAEHYQNANGRLPCVFLWLLIYRIGGLVLVKFFAALILTAIFVLLHHIAARTRTCRNGVSSVIACAVLCLCYGMISVVQHQHGTYWLLFLSILPRCSCFLSFCCSLRNKGKSRAGMSWQSWLFLLS